MSLIDAKRDLLLAEIRRYGSCAVAFSGGVDSAVVAKAAAISLGDRAVALTAVSPSLASGELEVAQDTARMIGIRHEVIHTQEIEKEEYARNQADRCFHCKDELYTQIEAIRSRLNVDVVCNGANVDDLGDYRPGLDAASAHFVRSPLADCEISKDEVRQLAEQWSLPVWDKPAAPCLSSRIAYGQQVTPQRLRMIDAAEQFLHARGFSELRVRFHEGELARIEVPANSIGRLCEEPLRTELSRYFRQLGFKFVTIDVQGFRSGNLNQVLPAETLQRKQQA